MRAAVVLFVIVALAAGAHRKPAVHGHWYAGCVPVLPNEPNFPECRPL